MWTELFLVLGGFVLLQLLFSRSGVDRYGIYDPDVFCRACHEMHLHDSDLCPACRSLSTSVSRRKKSEVTVESIRAHARRVMRHSGEAQVCDRCGHSGHVEVHHRRPVADFPEDAFVYEINSPLNLQYVCPNCHHFYHDDAEHS